MMRRWAVFNLGLTQLISWGVTYYLIGAFGNLIVADTGWSREAVYGGYSLALLVMGLSSAPIGALIDRRGGRSVMIGGAWLNALGCLLLALGGNLALYFTAWFMLGLGMRMSLYDAAFATLARLLGSDARRPISQITLLGGLASTVFWPIGSALAETLGWRGAVFAYAAISLLAVPLLTTLPVASRPTMPSSRSSSGRIQTPRRKVWAAGLFALIVTLANFLNSGMSAHMIAMMVGLGLSASTAIMAASFRGVGQSAARLCEVMFGARVDPVALNLFATLVLLVSFVAGFLAMSTWQAALVFAFMYGAGNGLLTITRGTVPLILFDPASYGRFVGTLVAPSFLLSATAPIAYAATITRYGEAGALLLSAAVATVGAFAALALFVLSQVRAP